jgi:Icc protein
MRILQLSDPHLLADPAGLCRGRPSLALLRHGLEQALAQLRRCGALPHRLLISGDLCHDEGWGGYGRLRDLLREPLAEALGPPLLLAGNHDHPWAAGAGPVDLDRAAAGGPGGGAAAGEGPLLVALHHPSLPIGDPLFDAIGLEEGERLVGLLAASPRVRGVVFGHVHQHWQGTLPGRPEVPLLGCPSTLCPFGPVQPCPLDLADRPGGRLLELTAEGEIRHRLLRWELPHHP